ncbi:hypothetical protein SAMN02745866_02039 [Alteromonadaceae bacterium Bs31]|nr:hypothetical protein SAMN02745866_02039 [Alteromonadaceae bacterium Bs31]
MSEAANEASSAPDPTSWSHIRETVNMLYLAVCQIEATMNDSNKSVDTLTHSFTTLATHTGDVSRQVQQLTLPQELDSFKQDLAETAAEMQSNINASIQAFQFYDRVCQRLDHVARSLEKVSSLMQTEERMFSPDEWKKLQEKIKGSYTMEAERIMFEFIMRGGSVNEALDIYRHHFDTEKGNNKDIDNDEIELF